jgi:hypothetical protein
MTRALRNSGALPEGRVKALQRLPNQRPQGYNGKLVRFRLVLDRDVPEAPETVAAKFPPDDQTMVTQSGALLGELRFYTRFASSAPVLTPRCYFGGAEPADGKKTGGTGFRLPDSTPAPILRAIQALSRYAGKRSNRRFLLLMEDLSDERFGDPYASCSEGEAAEIMRTLAALHARYWDDHALEKEHWLPRSSSFPHFFESQFNRRMEGKSDVHRDESDPLSLDIAIWLRSNTAAVFQRLAALPQTLLHGDPHLDNIYFSEGRVGLVDWQGVQRGAGVLDVARFIVGNLDNGVGAEEGLVRTYHGELVSRGVLDFSFDQCFQAFQLSKIYLFVVAALANVRKGDHDGRFDELIEIGIGRTRGMLPKNFRELLRP